MTDLPRERLPISWDRLQVVGISGKYDIKQSKLLNTL